MATLDHLNSLLEQTGKLLDEVASEIAELECESEANLRRVGQMIMGVMEIRLEIFKARPDLRPPYLRTA